MNSKLPQGDKPSWWPGIYFYPPRHRFLGLWHNVLPWIGNDGDETWCRQTIVIPLFGLGAIIIGLRWHLMSECTKEV